MQKLNGISIILLVLLITGCYGHHKRKISLSRFNDTVEVVYETKDVRFIFSHDALVDYCKRNDTGYFKGEFDQVFQYLKTFRSSSIVIDDSLGKSWQKDSFAMRTGNDRLYLWMDPKKPFAYVVGKIRWAVLEFASNGQMKIYDKREKEFADFVVVDVIEDFDYGETVIILPNDSIIFKQLRWIK